jgi:hypothetical protein
MTSGRVSGEPEGYDVKAGSGRREGNKEHLSSRDGSRQPRAFHPSGNRSDPERQEAWRMVVSELKGDGGRAGIPPGCGRFSRRWSGGVASLNHRLMAFHPSGMASGDAEGYDIMAGIPLGCGRFSRRCSGGVAALNHRLMAFHPSGMASGDAEGYDIMAGIPLGCGRLSRRCSGGVASLNHRLMAFIPPGWHQAMRRDMTSGLACLRDGYS